MRFTCTRCNYATQKKKLFLCHIMRKNPCGQFDEKSIKDVVLRDYSKIIDEIHLIILDECDCVDELQNKIDKLTALLKRMKFIEPITELSEFEQLDQLCYEYVDKQKIKFLHSINAASCS